MKSHFPFFTLVLFAITVFGTVKTCASENVKKSVDDNRDDNGETNDEAVKDESLDIPADNETNNVTCTRRQNSQMHEIRLARERQFPFMASIMSHQNEHLCSGVVVSNGLVLTTATCLQHPISYVLVNTTRAKKNETTTSLHVIKVEKFPTFTSTESGKDVGLIYTEKHNNSVTAKIRLSNFTSTRGIVDMVVIGFGLNADVGANKELQYVGLENRIGSGSFPEFKDSIYGYLDCLETKVLTCFKDTGGPSIYDNELVGIVTKGCENCIKEMSASYALNKKLVDVIPTYTFKKWLDEKIKKNELNEQNIARLAVFPERPTLVPERRMMITMEDKQSNSGQIKLLTVPFMAAFTYSLNVLI